MLKSHRKILLKTRVDLVRDLEPNEILNYLYQSNVLSENDVQLIKAERTRKARAELFLDMIPRKGPKAFSALIESLQKENGTKHLVEMLMADSDMPDGADRAKKPSTLKNEPKQATENIEKYPITHKPHGLCLIVNNSIFCGLPDRYGSDIDSDNLQELFSRLNFTVRKIKDATVSMMMQAIKEVAETEHSATNCLVICLLSHGVSGKIYDIHGELIEVSKLLNPLIICDNNPSLAKQPRLFFIQACRVTEEQNRKNLESAEFTAAKSHEVIIHSDAEPMKINEDSNISAELFIQDATVVLPANILLSYSTFPGEPSWRNSEKGSWFIEALVDVFKKHSSKEDVLSMLTMVNDIVSTKVSTNSLAKQIPTLINTLTKKLYLSG